LIEISDFFDEKNMMAPSQLIDHMRLEVRQFRVNFNFISTLKLLQACCQSQTHLQQHGRLPFFDLNLPSSMIYFFLHFIGSLRLPGPTRGAMHDRDQFSPMTKMSGSRLSDGEAHACETNSSDGS